MSALRPCCSRDISQTVESAFLTESLDGTARFGKASDGEITRLPQTEDQMGCVTGLHQGLCRVQLNHQSPETMGKHVVYVSRQCLALSAGGLHRHLLLDLDSLQEELLGRALSQDELAAAEAGQRSHDKRDLHPRQPIE